MVRVRRQGTTQDDVIIAGPAPAAAPATSIGLSMRRVDEGAEVTAVEPGGAAGAAGLRPGDVIVQVGTVRAPSPAAIRQAFNSLRGGGAIVAGIARGGTHHVIALEKDAAGDR